MIYAAAILLFLYALATGISSILWWQEAGSWRDDKFTRLLSFGLMVVAAVTAGVAGGILP